MHFSCTLKIAHFQLRFIRALEKLFDSLEKTLRKNGIEIMHFKQLLLAKRYVKGSITALHMQRQQFSVVLNYF